MSRLWWLIGLWAWPACQLEVNYQDGRYYCGDQESACPSGQSCVAQYCRTAGDDDPDASTVDANPFQPDADPSQPDASEAVVIDAAVIDARPGDPDAPPPPPDAAPPDATPACLMGNVADDFASSHVSPIWIPFTDGGPTTAETSGRLIITLVAGQTGSHYAGYVSAANTDARGQWVETELVNVPSASTQAEAFFKLQDGPDDFQVNAVFRVQNGVLYMETHTAAGANSIKTLTYSSTNHRHLAIEEKNGQVFFYTSATGSSWTLRDTRTTPFNFLNARIAIGAGTYQAESNPGIASFERINTGPSTDCRGIAAP